MWRIGPHEGLGSDVVLLHPTEPTPREGGDIGAHDRFKPDITGFRLQDCTETDGQVRYPRRPFAGVGKFMVSVQGVASDGDRGRGAVQLIGNLGAFAYSPHARVSAEPCNFSCHSSIFLVYSRCAFHRDPTWTDFALPWHHRQRGRGAAMTFEEILDQAMAMLQRRGRVTYRAIKLQFSLDDDHLQALNALRHLPETRDTCEQAIDLRLDLRNALHPLGEVGRELDRLREAEALAERLGDRHRLGQVTDHLLTSFNLSGDYAQVVEVGQRALAMATARGDVALQVRALLNFGRTYYFLGDYRQAIELLNRNVATLTGEFLHERLHDVAPPSILSRTWLVGCLAEVGAFAEGITLGEEGVRIARAVDLPYGLMSAYYGVGGLYLHKGDLGQAIPVLERGLEVCQAANISLLFPGIASYLGYAYVLAGRVAEALPLLEQTRAQAGSLRFFRAHQVAWLSEAHLRAGRVADATQLAEHALALARHPNERGYEA